MGARAKLFIVSMVLVFSVLLTTGLYLEKNLVQWLESRIAAELLHTANSGRIFLERLGQKSDISFLDGYADELGVASSSRITIIADDGMVLGDSHLTIKEVKSAENHGQRPEVIEAKRSSNSRSFRYSRTLNTTMLYIGVSYQGLDGSLGVIRAAHSLDEVGATYKRVRVYLIFAGLLALIASVAGFGVTSYFSTRKLRELVRKIHTDFTQIGVPLSINRFEDEVSGLAGSFCLLMDELQETFALLSLERSRINAVLEGMEEGVISIGKSGEIILINRMASYMLNIPRYKLGSKLSEVISHTDLHARLNDLENSSTFRLELKLEEPVVRQFLIVGSTIPDDSGCILVFQDVTSIRRLEQIRQDFVANVSHELRTPISVIQANAETLVNGALHDTENGIIIASIIEEEAIRLSKIISKLLDLSRIESDEHPFKVEPVQLKPAAEYAIYMVRELAAEKNIQIHVDYSVEQRFLADEDALKQVLLNLLDNAVKYIPPNSQIQIRSMKIEGGIRLEVEDNGPGISPEHMSRLFERFYRVDKGRSRKVGGTGLGLAITKHLIQRMGGSIGVDPILPNGTRFWILFSLPAYENE